MNNIVVAFCGPIGSGKSTISDGVAKVLGLPRASFGDYVRNIATQRGLEPDRQNLQIIGLELIESGWEPFCRAVLTESGWQRGSSVVIDGVRHLEAIQALQQVTYPLEFVLVFIAVEEKDRQSRLLSKGLANELERNKIEGHSTEAQVKSLRSRASLVVDGSRPIPELVQQVIEFVGPLKGDTQ